MNGILTRAGAVEQHLGDPWKREPFQSPALANVDKLSVNRPQNHMSIQDLARVGSKTGLEQVLRWKPRNVSTVTAAYALTWTLADIMVPQPQDLQTSGLDVVLSTTIFAIVGAVSLQNGALIAGRVAREKVLGRMAKGST